MVCCIELHFCMFSRSYLGHRLFAFLLGMFLQGGLKFQGIAALRGASYFP